MASLMPLLSSTTGAIYLFVYLSYPEFFVWNPTQSLDPLLGWVQFTSTIAWFITMLVPTALWIAGSRFNPGKSRLYIGAAFAWPGVLSILHLYLLFRTGNAGFAYLINYPIFIFTDILAPVVYLQLWRLGRNQTSRSGLVKNDFLFDSGSAN